MEISVSFNNNQAEFDYSFDLNDTVSNVSIQYHTENQLKKKLYPMNEMFFSLLHVNIRSYSKNFGNLSLLLERKKT